MNFDGNQQESIGKNGKTRKSEKRGSSNLTHSAKNRIYTVGVAARQTEDTPCTKAIKFSLCCIPSDEACFIANACQQTHFRDATSLLVAYKVFTGALPSSIQ